MGVGFYKLYIFFLSNLLIQKFVCYVGNIKNLIIYAFELRHSVKNWFRNGWREQRVAACRITIRDQVSSRPGCPAL